MAQCSLLNYYLIYCVNEAMTNLASILNSFLTFHFVDHVLYLYFPYGPPKAEVVPSPSSALATM